MQDKDKQEMEALISLSKTEEWKLLKAMTDIQVDAIRSRAIDTAKTEYDIGYWKGRKDGIHYVMGYPQHLEMALQEAESPVEEE